MKLSIKQILSTVLVIVLVLSTDKLVAAIDVSGHVYDVNENPLPDAIVLVFPSARHGKPSFAKTDQNGAYKVTVSYNKPFTILYRHPAIGGSIAISYLSRKDNQVINKILAKNLDEVVKDATASMEFLQGIEFAMFFNELENNAIPTLTDDELKTTLRRFNAALEHSEPNKARSRLMAKSRTLLNWSDQ